MFVLVCMCFCVRKGGREKAREPQSALTGQRGTSAQISTEQDNRPTTEQTGGPLLLPILKQWASFASDILSCPLSCDTLDT